MIIFSIWMRLVSVGIAEVRVLGFDIIRRSGHIFFFFFKRRMNFILNVTFLLLSLFYWLAQVEYTHILNVNQHNTPKKNSTGLLNFIHFCCHV